ncbi:alpha/beta fold hydrolase [Cupriavidus basilensis]|uniref:alpha/beta fold hydrolase n=1 Tax=Cupriavidus basilensis TaxID=68895 RepID=UPI00157B6C24|nr:alpha/beta hydrolase [Cupriavidus basilensis]NUA26629.1 alpha/beta hydrolase [Cupriavidus basilensis]
MSDWILLRGLTRETRHWGVLPGVLQTHAGIGPVTMLDLPGNGVEAAGRAPANVAAMVAFLRERAARQGLARPYGLLAMSLGAMVAAQWAQQHPEEIGALVLVNTSMRPFCSVAERLPPRNWPALLGMALRWHNAPYCERIVYRLTCNASAAFATDVAQWCAIRGSAPVSRANALRQLWAAARYHAPDAPPACPTLVLSSAADHLVDPVCSAHLAKAWGAQHRRHPWAGHDLPHDDPAWLAGTVARWQAATSASHR